MRTAQRTLKQIRQLPHASGGEKTHERWISSADWPVSEHPHMSGLLVGGPSDRTEVDIAEHEMNGPATRLVPVSHPTDQYVSERLTFRGKASAERDERVRLVHGGSLPESGDPVSVT
jgi:hypothetical protein